MARRAQRAAHRPVLGAQRVDERQQLARLWKHAHRLAEHLLDDPEDQRWRLVVAQVEDAQQWVERTGDGGHILGVGIALLLHDAAVFAARAGLDLALHAVQATALLHHVGQLVRDQAPPLLRLRLESARREEDVPSHREGTGAHRLRQLRSVLADVDAHAAEAGAEARLHQRRERAGQRRAATQLGEAQALLERGAGSAIVALVALLRLIGRVPMDHLPPSAMAAGGQPSPSLLRGLAVDHRFIRRWTCGGPASAPVVLVGPALGRPLDRLTVLLHAPSLRPHDLGLRPAPCDAPSSNARPPPRSCRRPAAPPGSRRRPLCA